jgi:hypothetical protein
MKGFAEQRIQGKFVLMTEPPITRKLFDEIQRILRDPSPIATKKPLLNSIGLEYADGCLLFNSPKVDDHLKRNIQSLLDVAEKNMANADTTAAQLAAIRKSQQDESIQAAAEGFGIPVIRRK